jgi:LMBR1 domain-containing protein 1
MSHYRAVLSVVWLVHIGIYLVPQSLDVIPIDTFLNSFFISTSNVPFVGIALYALFSFYLLATVVKGNIKLGMRILFITMHPMKYKLLDC